MGKAARKDVIILHSSRYSAKPPRVYRIYRATWLTPFLSVFYISDLLWNHLTFFRGVAQQGYWRYPRNAPQPELLGTLGVFV